MIMGFHYTQQYSRRSRVNVMGLVDQSTEAWSEWYRRMHEPPALRRIAAAGYALMEVHFLYGFGLQGEREEVELTRRLVAHAHQAGIKVLGYFQFFSVQSELFFLENPWARECLQLKNDGTPHEYAYNRPALCFSHEEVRQYYLDGVELGLSYCDLDGIRLDNDYFKGCYCERCQEAFRAYLERTFDEAEARRVFGLSTLAGVSLVPAERCGDPLWAATVRFRQSQRQDMMKAISQRVQSVRQGAILGGNPAVSRGPADLSLRHVYPPDLGETHHLVCAENSLFPGRTGDSIRHQVVAYKFGQSSQFKVYPSHHLYTAEGRTRWPETREECALSLCEALCFGGHVACTTWGMRMDGATDRMLFERPHFLAALQPVRDFLAEHGHVYCDVRCNATVGVYVNRESLSSDYGECWYSLQGLIQILLAEKIPFRFVDRDNDASVAGLDVLIIPNMRLVATQQMARFAQFAESGKILMTGDSCRFDEHFLRRPERELTALSAHGNVDHLPDAPEMVAPDGVEFHGVNHCRVPMPRRAQAFTSAFLRLYQRTVKVEATPFVAIDRFTKGNGTLLLHVLNYDNCRPTDVQVTIRGRFASVDVVSPGQLGPASDPVLESSESEVTVSLPQLGTYAVIAASEG